MAQILPDVFLAVELGAIGREFEQRDVFWDFQGMGGMPACAVHDDHGMASHGNMARYFKEMLVHGIGVGKG